MTEYVFPNAVMQYAIPDLETLTIDRIALAKRRDRLMNVLEAMASGRFGRREPSILGGCGAEASSR